jgi:hypothetical protein
VIKVHVAADGAKSFQVYGRARIREKSVRVHVGSFAHDAYASRMRLYVRPTFDRTPLVKITKPKLLDLRTSLKEREEPIGNATTNTLFATPA